MPLGVVVGGVEEPAFALLDAVAEETLARAADFIAIVVAADEEGEEAFRSGRKLTSAALITKSANRRSSVAPLVLGLIAAFDVANGFIDRLLRHVEAGIPGGAQRHGLPDGDGHIAITRIG
jgi:hypothetical protein